MDLSENVGGPLQSDAHPRVGRNILGRGHQPLPDYSSLTAPRGSFDALYHCDRTDADVVLAHPSDGRADRNPLPCLRLTSFSRLLSRLAGGRSRPPRLWRRTFFSPGL